MLDEAAGSIHTCCALFVTMLTARHLCQSPTVSRFSLFVQEDILHKPLLLSPFGKAVRGFVEAETMAANNGKTMEHIPARFSHYLNILQQGK